MAPGSSTTATAALGQAVTKVAWQNMANNLTGTASGTNAWSVASIPLVSNHTNVISVTATTTSWAAGNGGSTTFNRTLTVVQAPIRATLALQATNALLNWTGGGAPLPYPTREWFGGQRLDGLPPECHAACDIALGWSGRFLPHRRAVTRPTLSCMQTLKRHRAQAAARRRHGSIVNGCRRGARGWGRCSKPRGSAWAS